MAAAQEAITSLQEQLGLDDKQLAVIGITRSIGLVEKEVASAQSSITFHQNYRPTPPGPRPHAEAGGMDHQDWEIAAFEYAHADDERDEAVGHAEGRLQEAEDKLSDLWWDKEQIDEGDEEITYSYAAAERRRIQEEIDKKRSAQNSAERQAAYLKGTEIAGATSLRAEIETFVANPILADVRGQVSPAGWKFAGKPSNRPNCLMFERMDPAAADVPAHSHYKFNNTELLTLDVAGDGSVRVHYTEATDIDEAGVQQYGKDIAAVDYYSFKLTDDGYVGEQNHEVGRATKWLPYHMDNGTISHNMLNPGSLDMSTGLFVTGAAITRFGMNTADMAKMSDKVAEVAAAMKELNEQAYQPRGHVADNFEEVRAKLLRLKGDFTDASQANGEDEFSVSNPADGASIVTKHTNHHGGHQYLDASAIKMKWTGQTTEYNAHINTMAWGRSDPQPSGELRVSKYDRMGREIYRFATKRPGAAEKLAKIVLKHIGRNADDLRRAELRQEPATETQE